jgi:hypothetical protein
MLISKSSFVSISVRIFWVEIRIINTIIYCLLNESKEILPKNVIIISSPNSKPPIFNYASFCKFMIFVARLKKILKILKYDLKKNKKKTEGKGNYEREGKWQQPVSSEISQRIVYIY